VGQSVAEARSPAAASSAAPASIRRRYTAPHSFFPIQGVTGLRQPAAGRQQHRIFDDIVIVGRAAVKLVSPRQFF
jgi:hypothetical protein